MKVGGAFAYGAPIGLDSDVSRGTVSGNNKGVLSGTDECEASGDVCNAWKQDGTNDSSDGGPGIPHLVPSMWKLRITRLAIGCFNSFRLKVLSICSSAPNNSVAPLRNSWKITQMCQVEFWQGSWFNSAYTPYLLMGFCLATILSKHVNLGGS